MIHCSPFIRKPSGPDITYERRCKDGHAPLTATILIAFLQMTCTWAVDDGIIAKLFRTCILSPFSYPLAFCSLSIYSFVTPAMVTCSHSSFTGILATFDGLDGTVYFTCLRQADQNSNYQILPLVMLVNHAHQFQAH